MSPFLKDPGPPDYGVYLCSPAELEASYNRCRALQVPVGLKRPQKILPKTLLDPRVQRKDSFLTAVERVITPHHYASPQDNHIYILAPRNSWRSESSPRRRFWLPPKELASSPAPLSPKRAAARTPWP